MVVINCMSVRIYRSLRDTKIKVTGPEEFQHDYWFFFVFVFWNQASSVAFQNEDGAVNRHTGNTRWENRMMKRSTVADSLWEVIVHRDGNWLHVEKFDRFLMLSIHQGFCEYAGHLFTCGDMLDVNLTVLIYFTNEVVTSLNMLCTWVIDIVFDMIMGWFWVYFESDWPIPFW